jgi:DHA2 family multidrug resistance protein
MTWFLTSREKFHSNLLGLNVAAGDWLAGQRIRMLSAKVLAGSTGPEEARLRAIGILSGQVRAQAYTMSVADGFVLIAWMVVGYLLLMVFLRPAKIGFRQLRNMP